MKQVLLMMPSYYDFDAVIKEGLENHSGYQVANIDTSPKFAYRHLFDRILNFISKTFLNKNLKPEMQMIRFEAVEPIASAISPVPGGVGPMTITMLMYNTVKAAFTSQLE